MDSSARVILIGNGPSATNEQLGNVIDDYDIVVRFNCWRTNGLEDRLGSHCDIWAVNLSPNDTEKFLPKHAKSRRPGRFLVFPGPATACERVKQISLLIKQHYPGVPREIVPQSYPIQLINELGKRATTGLVALYYLLDLYKKVDLHGFDILAGKGCMAEHYWGGGSNISRTHTPSGEAKMIRKLIQQGRVGLLVKNIEPFSVNNPCQDIELPKHLHFVWVGSSPPQWLREFMGEFEKLHPEWKITLWKHLPDDADALIKAAYEGAAFLCQRADLLRYWVLYKHGGIYVDSDMLAHRCLEPLRFLGPVWAACQHDGRINNACMGALPGHPVMRLILDATIDVYRSRMDQGFSFPTKRADYGPNLLTRLKAEGTASDLVTVHKHYFYPLDKRASAHVYWKSSSAKRKSHIKKLRDRFVDGEQPFMVHLWGVKNSSNARIQQTSSTTEKFKTVSREVRWTDRNKWLWPANDKELLQVFEQVDDIDVIMNHVTQRRICVQAGGACGVWPLRFSMFFEAVYTFEPSHDTFQCLNHNCVATNVYRYQAGLFSREGFSGMNLHSKDKQNWGAKFIDLSKNDGIPLMRLDSFEFEHVDLIQLDIEGSELDALKGCKRTIERCHPVIVIEEKPLKHLIDFGQKVGDARRWLARHFNYKTVATVGRDIVLSTHY